MCSYVSTYGDEADFTYDGDIVVRSGKDQLKELIKTYNMAYVVVWTKIYKKEIFNDLRFPVGKINEDAFLNYKFYYKSQKVAYINNKMYGYFQSNNSIMRSGTYLKKDDLFVAMEERRKFLVDNNCGDELIDMSDVDYSNTLLYYYVLSKKYNTNNENAINRLENRVNKNYFNVMKENKYPIKLKLQYFLYKHFRKIFIWIKCKKVLK